MYDTLHADYAIRQLQKKHEKPFFIACGMFHPHMPWYVPQKYLDLYLLNEVVVPAFKQNDLEDVPPLGKAFSSVNTVEKILAHDQHQAAIQGYLASSSYADAQLGRVLDALEQSPYKENTLVVFWSDHGFHLGEKMHWQKGTLWEEATHCLLMFRVPGVTPSGSQCSQLVSLLDIYPTLVELCGLPDPGHLDGGSLLPLLKDPSAQRRTHVITAYDGQIAVRTDRYRYIRYSDGTDELYDRTEDWHEWLNLTRNPALASVKQELNALLPAPAALPEALPWSRKRAE
jgi:arylsulfatase A-like enzyme